MAYKGFKKVHEDNDKAVLKNGKGHSITIAKNALSKEHLDQLKGLKLHAADGTEIPEEGIVPDRQPAMSAMPVQEVQNVPAQQSTVIQQAPDQVRQQARQKYEADHAAQNGIEDAKWGQDLTNGHITPETYRGMFEKKSTMGKIGTILGVMLSGAGSGLSHQPNMALEMMNNEIKNDLDAQTKSKENAKNYYNLNLQHELNKADIALKAQQEKGAVANTALTKAQIDRAHIDNAKAKALNQMIMSAVTDGSQMVDKMPPGPNKERAVQTLNTLKQGAAQQMANNNLTSAKSAADLEEQRYVESIKRDRNLGQMSGEHGFVDRAQSKEDHYIPNVGTFDKYVDKGDKDTLTKIANFQNLLKEAEEFHNNKLFFQGKLGAVTPSQEKIANRIHNDLISSYNDVKGLNRFTGNEEKLYKEIVPDVGKRNLTDSQMELLKNLKESVQSKSDLEMKRMGGHPFNKDEDNRLYKKEDMSRGSTPPDGTKGMYKGKPVIFKNGKVVFQ